jgi:hypothetical protein
LYAWSGKRLDAWDPNVFLAALTVGVLALVVFSLLTSPEPSTQVGSFFDRLETSSDDDGSAARPASAYSPLLLVHLLDPVAGARRAGWRAYREDLWGFALGWAIVVGLIGTAVVLLRIEG